MTVPCYNKFRPRLWSVWSSREEFAKMKLLLSLSMPFFSSFATNVSIFAAGTLKSAVLRFSGDNRGIEGNEDIFTTWPLSKWNTVYSVASNDDGTQQRRSKRLLFPPFFSACSIFTVYLSVCPCSLGLIAHFNGPYCRTAYHSVSASFARAYRAGAFPVKADSHQHGPQPIRNTLIRFGGIYAVYSVYLQTIRFPPYVLGREKPFENVGGLVDRWWRLSHFRIPLKNP